MKKLDRFLFSVPSLGCALVPEWDDRAGRGRAVSVAFAPSRLAGWLMILLLLGCCLAAGPGAEGLVVIEHRKIGSFPIGFDLVSELN